MMYAINFMRFSLIVRRRMSTGDVHLGDARCSLWAKSSQYAFRINPLKKMFRVFLAVIAVTQLSACAKTVQWEEEVPLNTGEVIWVKRTVEYTVQGGAGNPLDLAYRPTPGGSVTEFTWRGKPYRFDVDTSVVLIAVSPQGHPVLVGEGDYWNLVGKYPCTVPLYVQFVPDATGRNWTWPSHIEPWLYNLETNRLFAIPTPDHPKQRYTVEERKAANASGIERSRSRQRIDPAYTGDLCKPKEN